MSGNHGLRLAKPRTQPVLDAQFRPAVLTNRRYRERISDSPDTASVSIALERQDGLISRYDTRVFNEGHDGSAGNFRYIERLIKFLLWARGGYRIHFAGPESLYKQVQRHYVSSPTGTFDAEIMGNRIYEKPFDVIYAATADVPANNETAAPLGRHLDGCRIGFDLGASDRKAAAVIDGKVVFSEEVVWDPKPQTDPDWHFREIMNSLERAAKHLPRVDAIGGSSAGVYVNNRVQVASLFRSMSSQDFETAIKPLFLRIQDAWDGIPFVLVNDGEVTALAGSMALNDNAVLGIAMGSSEAAGYVTPDGNITSWLNELAFAPVDYNPQAPVDEWSGDKGCGVNYFSQQSVARLMAPAGIEDDPNMPVPKKLVKVQQLMGKGDERAAQIYETIGTYLGYTIAHYSEFYDFRYLLVLGRVTTGAGGDMIIAQAKNILKDEFPEISRNLTFHIPDEKEKRHGQAIAAASLPLI